VLSDDQTPSPSSDETGQPAEACSLQACDFSCRYARNLADTAYAEDWLWCARPDRANRLVRAGRECPCYQAAAHRFDHAG